MLKQYHYDQDKNLTGLFVQSGNAILANNRYLYDGNGNRTRKQQLGGETLYHYDPVSYTHLDVYKRQTLDHKGQAPLIAADLEKELAHVAEGL